MNTSHLILEWSYFASGVVLAIIAGIGLRQLTVAKNVAKINAKRESFRLAAEQCTFYLKHVVDALNAVDTAIIEHEITFFQKSSVEVKGDKVKVHSTASNAEHRELLEILEPLVDAYN